MALDSRRTRDQKLSSSRRRYELMGVGIQGAFEPGAKGTGSGTWRSWGQEPKEAQIRVPSPLDVYPVLGEDTARSSTSP